MSERLRYRPIETSNVNALSVDGGIKVYLEGKERLLPPSEINKIVNVGEVFNQERQASTCYRLMGTFNTLFSNVLFNVTGPDSWASFMTPKFRDGSYPSNSIDPDEEEDLTYNEAIKEYLEERNGWFGYTEPDLTSPDKCVFFDMTPKRTDFYFTRKDKIKNWELTITYPTTTASTVGDITYDGLLIVEAVTANVGGRVMTAFAVPVKHNLPQGGTVRISGLANPAFNGDYQVVRRGLDNGDLKDNYFVVDIDPVNSIITGNARMKRLVSGEESRYYYRVFEKVPTTEGVILDDNDYELYPTAFSRGLYNDTTFQFVFNADIDVAELKDNLGRPLTEMYLTVVKTDSNGIFGEVESGIEMPYIGGVGAFLSIPDVRRLHNGGALPVQSHTPLESNILISQSQFYGDVAEYNRFEVREYILGEVRHRFNTVNREAGGSITDPVDASTLKLGVRQEGYFYKPHHQIKLREFSAYIEQGDVSTAGIPDYAEDLGDGRFLWRDLLDIGFNDGQEDTLDYPFLNGCHYIHQIYCLPVRRQDPFGQYNLIYTDFPRDIFGDRMTDRFEVKQQENVC